MWVSRELSQSLFFIWAWSSHTIQPRLSVLDRHLHTGFHITYCSAPPWTRWLPLVSWFHEQRLRSHCHSSLPTQLNCWMPLSFSSDCSHQQSASPSVLWLQIAVIHQNCCLEGTHIKVLWMWRNPFTTPAQLPVGHRSRCEQKYAVGIQNTWFSINGDFSCLMWYRVYPDKCLRYLCCHSHCNGAEYNSWRFALSRVKGKTLQKTPKDEKCKSVEN